MRATESEEQDDWILLDATEFEDCEQVGSARASDARASTAKTGKKADKGNNIREPSGASSLLLFISAKARQRAEEQRRQRQMALDANDIELIRASWIPARKDPTGSGVLLFKGLFTKFPDYLRFFSKFADLDIESLHQNKRLIKHAVKVIDTVTFVVDSIGDESKADQLNEALINLVASHLKRQIGLKEFRNLGIVIIDFICDLQQRRTSPSRSSRTSSPCENASLEPMVSSETESQDDTCTRCQFHNHSHSDNHHTTGSDGADSMLFASANDSYSPPPPPPTNCANLDTSLLVAAWTKLYGSILDLVKRQGGDNESVQ